MRENKQFNFVHKLVRVLGQLFSIIGMMCLFQTCSASGFPQAALYWLKDGQPLRTGARIRIVSRERISVTSVAREDRGMYQCFVRNEHEMAQGIAELRLGGKFFEVI